MKHPCRYSNYLAYRDHSWCTVEPSRSIIKGFFWTNIIAAIPLESLDWYHLHSEIMTSWPPTPVVSACLYYLMLLYVHAAVSTLLFSLGPCPSSLPSWPYNLASSPGHSQLFNVARWKARGPGTRRHVSDVSPRTDLESTLLCVGAFFILWLTYRHFVAFLNSSLVRGKIGDYAEKNK